MRSRCRLYRILVLATAALSGCQRSPADSGPPATAPAASRPALRLVHPERKSVRHSIEQPGFNLEAYQETALFARIAGYVAKWHVDIGDRVKKDDVLAELYVPEMDVELKQKEAALRQAGAQLEQARAAVEIARAQLERAVSQHERFQRLSKGGTIDRENLDEARLGAAAARAGLAKVTADVDAADAYLEVVRAQRDFCKTMLQYAKLRAPYDAVVTQRNINTGDLVQPEGKGAKDRPLFVVQQIDPVRVFVNVPGSDAPWVRDGDPVSLRVQGAGGAVYQGKVTRTAHMLNPQARTLRTEIDLANSHGKLLPGMYVHASILVQHADVWTLPASAVVTEADQTICYRVVKDRAVRTPLQIGLSGGGLVEVMKKQVATADEARWEEIDGSESVAASAAGVSDGQEVK